MIKKPLITLVLTVSLCSQNINCLVDITPGDLRLYDGAGAEAMETVGDLPGLDGEVLDIDQSGDDGLLDSEAREEGPCLDNDGDGYGAGAGCLGPDCDDGHPSCNVDCLDHDGDGVIDCLLCPASPSLAAQIDTSGEAWYVDVVDRYAYVAARTGGLRIIDMGATTPEEVGFYEMEGGASWFSAVRVSGRYAYVADEKAGLVIIDVLAPASPARVSTFGTAGHSYDLRVDGTYAYIADDYEGGLRIVDVADTAAPREVGFFDTPGAARGIQVDGRLVYMADGGGGLRVMDVGNPAGPVELGSYGSGSGRWVQHVHRVSGSYVFLASGADGMEIVDVSDPSSPALVGRCDTPGTANGVYEQGGYVYVADGEAGLRIIDARDVASPTEIGSYNTPGIAWKVEVAGGYAYVADGPGGLLILSLFCE